MGHRPGPEAATLLTLYDFTLANKLFSHHFVTSPAPSKEQPAPFSAFISFLSYLYQHAYRSARASAYAYLSLLTLLILVEDSSIARLLCETTAPLRLCRQRPPYLPLPKSADRPYATAMLDLLVDGLNHNLRKRLDVGFYMQDLTVLLRLTTHLSKTRTKLAYHWSELWRSLLSFIRFLNQYATDLQSLHGINEMIRTALDTLVLALTSGEAFLSDAKDYDDLFYKLVESGEALVKLKELYHLNGRSSSVKTNEKSSSPINTLISVSSHYDQLISEQKAKKEHLSPREVMRIIKQGYETLTLEAKEGDGEVSVQEKKFREVEHKGELKKIARTAVGDAGVLVSRGP
jgi:hypothetical protein